nr:MAG TPA: hypothetical protein [Caudoviricetes sp.]
MKTEYAYAAFNISTNNETVSTIDDIILTVTYIGESLKGAEVYTSNDMTPVPIDSTNQITLSNNKVWKDIGYVIVYVRSTKVPDYVKTLILKSTL